MVFGSSSKNNKDESSDVHQNYLSKDFSNSDEAPTQLINMYLELNVDGLLKYHAKR